VARLWHGGFREGVRRAAHSIADGVSKESVKTTCGFLLEHLDGMDVDARSDRDGLMAKGARDGLQVHARG
jgi:hypothetical protein